MVAEIKEDDRDGEYYASHKLKASLPNSKDRKQISLVPVEIVKDVKKSGSDNSGYKGIQGSVCDKLRVRCDITAEPPYDEDCGEKSDDHHQAVAPYGQRGERYFKKFTVHFVRVSCLVARGS